MYQDQISCPPITSSWRLKSVEEKSFSSSGLSYTYGWWLVIKERPRSYSSTFPSSRNVPFQGTECPYLIPLRKGLQELYTPIFLERLLSIVEVSPSCHLEIVEGGVIPPPPNQLTESWSEVACCMPGYPDHLPLSCLKRGLPVHKSGL